MKPLQKGDQAEIIAGALGDKGPNIGKRVTVGMRQGEHSKFGTIWRVHGEGLVTEYGAVGTELDCAQSWLRRIEPTKAPDQHTTRDQEITA